MRRPIWVYDNWSAYTEGMAGLDVTRLTEELAMDQLRNVERLRTLGVQIDYYMMNAFWFQPEGGYLEWRTPDWPEGPSRWLAACAQIGVTPGLWFGTNTLWQILATPAWRDSVDPRIEPGLFGDGAMSISSGGFFADFLSALQHWYDRGIRLFEFDAANFDAGTEAQHATLAPDALRDLNIDVFTAALTEFRQRNPDVFLAGFNGFGGDFESTSSPIPFTRAVDPRFLTVLDSIYTGDIHVSDVPHESFWRSLDIFADHMVKRFEANGVPLDRLDPLGFVMSTTWFGARRGARALRSQILLTAARGSVKKTIYGDVGFMSDSEAEWFAGVQRLYAPLWEQGETETFGGMPGALETYGYLSSNDDGALCVVVNPSQDTVEVVLPDRVDERTARVIFTDSGFAPVMAGRGISLGPGQLALVAAGSFARDENVLGVEPDVVIPDLIAPVEADFVPAGPDSSGPDSSGPDSAEVTAVSATVIAPGSRLRVVGRQFGPGGRAHPTVEYLPQAAETLNLPARLRGRSFEISARQGDRSLRVERSETISEYNGISWIVGEIPADEMEPGVATVITVSSRESDAVTLEVRLYAVEYRGGPIRT